MTPKRDSRPAPVLAEWGELRFLEWVRHRFQPTKPSGRAKHARLELSIGDDAAHLRFQRSNHLLVTTDALIENVHFRHEWISPRDLGFKAMVSNLSDLAAMAARPEAAFLSLGVPPETPIAQLKAFFLGVGSAGHRWNCPLAGGDLVRSPQWTIHLTLLGSPAVKERVVTRSGAHPGQTVFVTGWPGESAGGLDALRHGALPRRLLERHRRPLPRLDEAAVLARVCSHLALIDISDGVASEALHVARESGVRLDIETARLPVSRALRTYSHTRGIDPHTLILNGGEDYELLFVTDTPEQRIRKAFVSAGLKTPITAIGCVTRGRGIRTLDSEGRSLRIPASRFDHFG